MEVILKKDVQSVGEAGDIVNVKDGYARNFLLPRNLAEVATAGAKENREKNLARIDKATPCRYGAPTVLVVAFDKNNVFTYPGGKRDSGIEDASIVATHLMLAAANEGVDSCWLNFFDPDALASDLDLPENEEILMLLDLGYAAEGAGPLDNHNSRKEQSETVSYI